jgi:hypothetical protein
MNKNTKKSVGAVVAGVLVIIVVTTLVDVVASWGKGLGPAWYPIALAVLAVPQCWAGGKLRVMQFDAGRRATQRG